MVDKTKNDSLLDYDYNKVEEITTPEKVADSKPFYEFSSDNWITPTFDVPEEGKDNSWEVPRNFYASEQNAGIFNPTSSTSTNNPTTIQGPVLGTEEFENAWKAYLQENPDDAKYKDFLTRTAQRESNFRSIQNTAGNPAYGYFQLWETNLGGNSPEEVLKDPKKQIQLAIQLLKNNISTFTDKDRKKAQELGYSENALLAGAWLGGVGGVRNFLYKGVNASDGHRYKDGKGDNIEARMKLFNFKEGGALETDVFPISIGSKTYKIKLAETEEDKSEGLSKKNKLADNEGMLFIIDDEDKDKEGLIWFTMEDTNIPLDIVFIDNNFEVLQVSKGEPLAKEPIYGKGRYVLEVNSNSGIVVGDELEFKTEKKVNNKMMVLDVDGNAQMTLDGGERIFSIKNTKILIKFAKKSTATKKDNDYKALGKRVFKFLKIQDSNEPEYV